MKIGNLVSKNDYTYCLVSSLGKIHDLAKKCQF